MPKAPEVSENQLVLPSHHEVVSFGEYPQISHEQRLSLKRLLGIIHDQIQPTPRAEVKDFEAATAASLKNNLLISPSSPTFHTAQHTSRLGVKLNHNPEKMTGDFGVVFPPNEYYVVAHNPAGLGFHTVNRTRRSREQDADRQGSGRASMRSAGHALIQKRHSQAQLGRRLNSELAVMVRLAVDLRTTLRSRFKLKNLEPMRVLADEKIHETVEVACLNLPESSSKNQMIEGRHVAVFEELYGDMSSNKRAQNWVTYLGLTCLHTYAKLYKLRLSYERCGQELGRYQPYLDERASEEGHVPTAA